MARARLLLLSLVTHDDYEGTVFVSLKDRERAAAACAMYGVFLALAALGCSAADESDLDTGNLGVGTFSYTCLAASDAACGAVDYVSGATPATFPQAFAVGSRIGIALNASATNVGNPVLQPVSTEFLTPSVAAANTFDVVKQGFGGLYAVSTVDSTFIDYTLLRLVSVSALTIGDDKQMPLASLSATASGSSSTLASGDTMTLTALPEADGVLLAGAQDLEWTVGDATVVGLNTANPTARMTVTALKSGTTTLTVTLSGMHASTTLTVP